MKKGTYRTVKLSYGNHYQQVLECFFTCGWFVKGEITPNYNIGQINHYITFESGLNATDVKIDFPNAHLV